MYLTVKLLTYLETALLSVGRLDLTLGFLNVCASGYGN